LLAGSSTGIASPPLAHAVALFVRSGVRDRTQTVINAGTGAGVALAGPVALLTVGQWRLAWWAFAVIAAVVTVWVARAVPRRDETGTQSNRRQAFLPG
ncbi:MFS transporter, partial [Burkholderia multivorans]